MSTIKERFVNMARMAWRPVAGVIGLVALVMWSSGMFESKVSAGKLDHPPGFALPAQARIVTVKRTPTPSLIEVIGTTAPEQMVNLSARIPAAIQSMNVAAGDAVTNGQILATLDDRGLREQMAGAVAQFRQADAEYDRAQQLFDKGASTDQARLAALTQRETARAGVEQARVLLSYAVVTAPFDGVITDRRFEAGDLAAPGQILMSVYDPRRMRFEVPVPVRLLSQLPLNRAVSIVLDGNDQPVKGKVSEIVSEVDPLSRTRKARIRLEPAALPVLPGTYGRITVEGDSHDSIWVPVSAVYRVGQQELIQVAAEGRVIRRMVKTGVVRGDQVEILSGLGDGETILAEPVKEG